MQFELIETGSEVRLRTAELELGWSRESGALVVLALPGGPNVLGHGPQRPGVDLALGSPAGWIARHSFARYLSQRCEVLDDAVAVTISIGLGPLKVRDRYLVGGTLVRRRVELEHVGLDEQRLYGVRLILPNARVGNPQDCQFEAPGNSVRPRVALAVAAAQRRDVLPRRFFAPGVRGGGALEPAPTQGPGLLALHGGPPQQTLLCWYASEDDPALPFLEGIDGWLDAVALAHEVGLAGALLPGERLATGEQYVRLVAEPWHQARARAASAPPRELGEAAWVAETPLFLAGADDYGGFAGLAARLPALAELGVGALVLRPFHLRAGELLVDLDRIDPALGDRAGLRALVDAAHSEGLKVLLDLALQGCAADSRYLIERPEWFAREADGGFVIGSPAGAPATSTHPGVAVGPACYNFDWSNKELQGYLLRWACAQLDELGLDGFRAVAPYSPALGWGRRPPEHASDAALAPLAWLERLRGCLVERSPAAVLLATLAGPAFGAVCDGVYDYQSHLMFVHTALRRMNSRELADYLDDLLAVAPGGAARICFMESHDTCELNPLADGLRGSRISRMLLSAMLLCGFVPSLWSGQEEAEGPFLRALLALWHAEPALRRGGRDFAAARCDSAQVFAVVREHAGRRLLGLMHTGPCTTRVSVALAGVAPKAAPRDLLALAPLTLEAGDGLLRLVLAPFSAYCLELD